jgi:hypothetical protein
VSRHLNPHPWPDVDSEVWDRLGGRDALVLGIGAIGFGSCISTYRTSTKLTKEDVTIRVRQAVCAYVDRDGRRRRLRIVESHMTGSVTPSLVIVDIQPSHWTWEWLVWALNPAGDTDTRRHRHQFYVGRLTEMSDERLAGMVEDVLGVQINPFR